MHRTPLSHGHQPAPSQLCVLCIATALIAIGLLGILMVADSLLPDSGRDMAATSPNARPSMGSASASTRTMESLATRPLTSLPGAGKNPSNRHGSPTSGGQLILVTTEQGKGRENMGAGNEKQHQSVP